jgi:tetratricopeptide (TPR) repeat protein
VRLAADKASPEHDPRVAWLVAALLVALLAVAAHGNVLGGEFVLDDRPFLVDNPRLTAPHSLGYFFTGDLYSYSTVGVPTSVYRPAFFAILWLSNALWPGSPLALHLLSLSLHLAATLLLLAIIPRLLPGISPWAAGIGAGLFAVHPVHVEAVAWISAFVHPMATALVLASYLFHDRYGRGRSPYALALAGIFFLIALFTAETAAGYPFLILVSDWIRHGRPRPLRAAPYFAVLAVYVASREAALGESVPLVFTDPEAWLRLPAFLAEYLRQLVLPYPQPLYLAMPPGWELSIASYLAVGALAVLLVFLVTQRVRDRRGVLLAAAWIGFGLLPALAASFHPAALFALRSLYLPSVGIALLVAWFAGTVGPAWRKRVLTVSAVLLLVPLGVTFAANRDWRDDGRVYGRIIAFNPQHYAGYIGLARYLERTGQTQAAAQAYERSIALAEPDDRVGPLESLGLLLGQSGQSARSLEIYRQVLALRPNRSSAWVGLGNNLLYLGRLPEAAEAYRKAHAADAGNREACHNLAMVLRKLGRAEEAALYAACAATPP